MCIRDRDSDHKFLDDQDTIDRLEISSLGIVNSYIGGLYDLEIEYNKKDVERNQIILKSVISIFMMDFYRKFSMNDIQHLVQQRYDETIELLQRVGKSVQPLYGLHRRLAGDPIKNLAPVVYMTQAPINYNW